jgi:hypothetical protein
VNCRTIDENPASTFNVHSYFFKPELPPEGEPTYKYWIYAPRLGRVDFVIINFVLRSRDQLPGVPNTTYRQALRQILAEFPDDAVLERAYLVKDSTDQRCLVQPIHSERLASELPAAKGATAVATFTSRDRQGWRNSIEAVSAHFVRGPGRRTVCPVVDGIRLSPTWVYELDG